MHSVQYKCQVRETLSRVDTDTCLQGQVSLNLCSSVSLPL